VKGLRLTPANDCLLRTWARPTEDEFSRSIQAGARSYASDEEVVLVKQGGDYGGRNATTMDPLRLVLAPEYGGDGGKKIGVCAQKTGRPRRFRHTGANA